MKVYSHSNKPNNILEYENALHNKAQQLENQLPAFLRDYFLFLRTAVSLSTRVAYLGEITFFCHYLLLEHPNLTTIQEIPLQLFETFTAQDFNYYISGYCPRYQTDLNGQAVVFENSNKSLSRKKSATLSLFKFLHRNGQITKDISGALNPIKVPKKDSEAIKRLTIEETQALISIVSTGDGLTEKEKHFWEYTRKRDHLIILFFVMYGLRVSELEALNVSSFNLSRDEYTIYRKRGKEIEMPLDEKLKILLVDYINTERKTLDPKDSDALFISTHGTRLTKRSIQNMIKKYTAIAMGTSKRNGYSPHKLRATAASTMIEKGFSIYDVQNLLDHENITTTQLYAAHRKNAKKQIIDHLDWLD